LNKQSVVVAAVAGYFFWVILLFFVIRTEMCRRRLRDPKSLSCWRIISGDIKSSQSSSGFISTL